MAEQVELELGEVDLQRATLRLRSGQLRKLTAREAAVLGYLAERPGQTLSRELLQTEVWGYAPDVNSRAVDNTIRRLRSKIEADPGSPSHVLTMHGEGYRFVPLLREETPSPEGLFGRSTLLERLEARIGAGAGVLTLTGPGGVGKTRLSQALLSRHGGHFVDLSAAASAGEVAASLAEGLGVGGGQRAIITALRQQAGSLIVLDNCEQVAAAAADWAARIQQATGRVLLATSRVALGCPGETVIEVPPLAERAGVALVAARLSSRQVPPPSAEVLSGLVSRLDGLPLALELAAARLGVLGAPALLRRLESTLELLGRSGDRSRHGTLRATVSWSWSMLSPAQQRVLARCTVFRGRFSAETAEAVLSGLDSGEDVLEALEALRAHSMLAAERDVDGRLRLRILEVIRLLAAEHLPGADPVWRRHARWAAQLSPGLYRSEHLNILAAWRWAVRHDPVLAVPLAEASAVGFRAHGPPDQWIDLAVQTGRLPLTGTAAIRAALVVFETAHALRRQPEPSLLDGAEAEAAALGEVGLQARIALVRGRWLRTVARLQEAEAAYEAGLAIAPAGLTRGHLRFDLASLAADQKRHAAAAEQYASALAEYRSSGAEDRVTRAELHLAMVRSEEGRLEEARRGACRALSALIRDGDQGGEGVVRCHLTLIAVEQGDLSGAERELHRAQACNRAVGARRFQGYGHLLQAMIWQDRGEIPKMLEEADRSVAILEEVGDPLFSAYARARRGVALALSGEPVRAQEELEAARRVMVGTGSPWTVAGVDVLMGFVALAEGNIDGARAALAAADRTAESSFMRIAVRQLSQTLAG